VLAQRVDLQVLDLERGSMPELDLPYFGATAIPVLPFRYSDVAIEVGPRLAQLGEDNYDVLARYLNYTRERVAELMREGVPFESQQITDRRDSA
jgi:hypothetical protein